MLTRNEIDIRIEMLRNKIAEEAVTSHGKEQAPLFDVGLALLGNLLGDISDIAHTARLTGGR